MSSYRTWSALLAAIVIVAASLWLRSGFPVWALGEARYDDFLFLRLAQNLKQGDWLGSYDNLTLAKGMFYPLFIAGASVVHLPLKVAEHLVYLTATGAFAAVLYRLSRSAVLALAVFTGLAFNPVLWSLNLARVSREGVYTSLCLGVVTATAAALAPVWGTSRARVFAFAGLAGVIGGAFWLTREEGAALLPALACIALFAVAAIFLQGTEMRRRGLAQAGVAMMVGLAVAGAIVSLVMAKNYSAYGVFADVEFKSPRFVSAYGALSRIEHDHWQRFVVVPREVREKAYAASPAAAELRTGLEGEPGHRWMVEGCAAQHMEPCPDILGGWFMWALREAGDVAGHYGTTAAAESFYATVAEQINAACDAGRLACLPPRRATLAPPFRMHYLRDTAAESLRMARLLSAFGEAEIFSYPGSGTDEQLALFSALGAPSFHGPDASIARFSGWVAGGAEPSAMMVVDSENAVHGTTTLTPAPDVDVTRAGKTLIAHRFTAAPDCPASDCRAVFTFADGMRREIPLAVLGDYPARDPAFVVAIDDVTAVGAPATLAENQRQLAIHRIARFIARIYTLVTPLLAVTGALGICAAVWAFRRDPALFFLAGLGVAAIAQVISRVALLAYLDVTTIQSFQIFYLSPATPFVIVVMVLGNWFAAVMLRKRL